MTVLLLSLRAEPVSLFLLGFALLIGARLLQRSTAGISEKNVPGPVRSDNSQPVESAQLQDRPVLG